ncbi:MAG: radical SAM protein [Actinobacteria bacterium]|nr:radical SAM protein [Actinomycetota bacterium]
MPSSRFLRLADGVFLKRLEFPAVYNTLADELYEVDPTGFSELARCDGTLEVSDSRFPPDFLDYCFEENILIEMDEQEAHPVVVGNNEVPSLRYLMLEVTDRCNLACRHCYLGEGSGQELEIATIGDVLDELGHMGGLRLVLTGGEPLLHQRFSEINKMVETKPFRSVLVTNATLIDDEIADELRFNEVQVSLDGMEKGHDFLRGAGSFKEALRGVDSLRRAGKALSVATMVHLENLDELERLESLVRERGAVSWTIDVPCETGRISDGGDGVIPTAEDCMEAMEHSFGSELHEPSEEYACGAHLACVKASGVLTKCGFYEDWNGGAVTGGLRKAWISLPKMKLADLECDCIYLRDCGGGCRFRAERLSGRTGPDPLKCFQFGV